MFSQTAEYALRAIVWLARHPGTPMTVQEIAGPTEVPAGYLSKVLQALGRASLVMSQRGLGGGFVLARHPKDLTVLDVIAAVDPVRRIRGCPLRLQSRSGLCSLHRSLDDAIATVEATLRKTTVADLLREPRGVPLCEWCERAVVARSESPTR